MLANSGGAAGASVAAASLPSDRGGCADELAPGVGAGSPPPQAISESASTVALAYRSGLRMTSFRVIRVQGECASDADGCTARSYSLDTMSLREPLGGCDVFRSLA